jgi:hypothetical protein
MVYMDTALPAVKRFATCSFVVVVETGERLHTYQFRHRRLVVSIDLRFSIQDYVPFHNGLGAVWI